MDRKRSWWHHLKEKQLSEKIAAFLLYFWLFLVLKLKHELNIPKTTAVCGLGDT